ncbi:hypothetical protein HDV02_002798 [Globomyces sp. JEL0801]|nr:hypothetical protein HDV02_002798 [Globomyces sp. JEL0801]
MTLQLSMSAILNRIKITSLRYLKYLAKWNPFALVWCLNLWFFEIMLINLYIWGCYWPRVGLKDQVNALVIADPQLTDAYSYKQSRGILLSLTEFYSDIYMKRNFARLQSSLNPSVVIFVGDLMDGGREWTDAQYINNSLNYRFYEELVRFRKVLLEIMILDLDTLVNTFTLIKVIPYAYSRYLSTFGRLNTITTVANHSIIALDTIGLSGRPESQAYKTAHEFLQSLTLDSVGPERRILLTHVPFWRPENSECGPRRRAKPLTNRRDFIQPDIANNVLRAIKPDLIISGDDHDDCVYVHRIDGMEITEHSVGTFSWLQGNIYPAVGVMSFRPLHAKPYSMDAKSYSLEICSLPQQLPIYYWYICLLVISLVGNVINHQVNDIRDNLAIKEHKRKNNLDPVPTLNYTPLDAKQAALSTEPVTNAIMSTREFIHHSLYHPTYGYFSKQAQVFTLDEPIEFNKIKNNDGFMKHLASLYEIQEQNQESKQIWHTPTEIFQPWYGNALANYILAQYKSDNKGNEYLDIYEIGAGNGTLMSNILDYIRMTEPQIYTKTRYNIIEISHQLSKRQYKQAEKTNHKVQIINKSIFDWSEAVPQPCFFIAMEVLVMNSS